MSKKVIVIPTYNEMGNIEITLSKIQNLNQKFDVVVVDDNSPDGTGDYVQEAIDNKRFNIKIILIRREGKKRPGNGIY